MHELGHNLGLRHGGGDDTNYKPNYLSVMNYSFQLQGVIKGGTVGTFDYSRAALPALDKAHLNESAGLGPGAAGYGTKYFCGAFQSVLDASGSIDWNCDGMIQPDVSADINQGGSATGTLTGFNDWAHPQLKGGAIGLAGATPHLPLTTEPGLLTVDVAKKVGALDGIPPTTSASATMGASAIPYPPSITFAGNAGTYTIDQMVSIVCSAHDALSGLASSSCQNARGPAWSFAPGSHQLAATASDNAGNSGSSSATFVVISTFASQCSVTRVFDRNLAQASALCTLLTNAQHAATNPSLKASYLQV